MQAAFLPYPTFFVGRATASANTAFTQLIPPFPGAAGAPLIYSVDGSGIPNWSRSPGGTQGYSHVTDLVYTTGNTLHQIAVMRPLNWTTFSAAVAKNVTNIGGKVTADPGTWQTAGVYKYPLPGGVTTVAATANNTISTGDYVAYQLSDGTWQLDSIASGTFAGGNLTLTTGTPNTTTGTIAANSPLFWYGIVSDTDPATGMGHPQWDTTANTTNEKFQSNVCSLVASLHPGDPIFFYSPNGTAAGKLSYVAGFFARH
jgi:hypothetical protein